MSNEELIERIIGLERELAQSKAEHDCLKTRHAKLVLGVQNIREEVRDLRHTPLTSCDIIGGITKVLLS
jgi:hypothetical protein